MSERTRTTFKVTVAGRRVVDFSTLRKGDKFILQDDDPIFPFTTRPSEVAEEMTEIEDKRILATALGASKDFLEGPTTYSTSSLGLKLLTVESISRSMDLVTGKVPCDEYVKANLVSEMRRHRGRKRLRKKKAKRALRRSSGWAA